jgi:glycosyltransferase involved in cell wall biosynthesis
MRIGLEMFGAQTAGRNRGIGRYGRNLAAALIARARPSHELILYADASDPLDRIPSGPGVAIHLVQPEPSLGAAMARLTDTNPDGLDALVLLNPLELTPGYDPPARPRRGPALMAVVYDLIPLLFPEGYMKRWPAPSYARRYLWTLERLRQYDQLLAISDATRDDVVRLLGVSPDRVTTIGTGGDDIGAAFDVGSNDVSPGFTEPFVFAFAATDPRKNLRGLLDAYARLPRELRDRHRLVVAAGVAPDDREAAPIWEQADSLGIRDRLTLTGFIDDNALGTLYRRCSAFVFPSLYEGFGLPIVEAFQCGAAVVAGDNSSQPEVAGDAALLVNTADPDALAAAIARVLTDEELARNLRAHGPTRAALFTWDHVASRTLEAIELQAVASKAFPPLAKGGLGGVDVDQPRAPGVFSTSNMARPAAEPTPPNAPFARGGKQTHSRRHCSITGEASRPRWAFFSPLPPQTSGIATYSASLVQSLSEHARIDLFHDAGDAPFARFQSRALGCYDARIFPRWNRLRPHDAVIYQLGNSPAHIFAYERLFQTPGVVVLHDPALASFHYERAMRSGGGIAMFRAVLDAAHPGRRPEYEPLLNQFEKNPEAMVAALTKRGFDMNGEIVAKARAVIVHSQAAADRLGPEASAKTFIFPLGTDAESPLTAGERSALRARLGLPAHGLIVGRFGAIHPTKLDVSAIEAFADLLRLHPDATLLMVGEEADGGCSRSRVEALGLNNCVRFWGRPDDARFLALMRVTDIGLALRKPPTNGESSAALVQLMRCGVAAIVTDVGSFAGYPDDVVRKISWRDDAAGGEALCRALHNLAANPTIRESRSAAGRALVEAQHSWARVARMYADLIAQLNPPAPLFRGPHTNLFSQERART